MAAADSPDTEKPELVASSFGAGPLTPNAYYLYARSLR